MFKVELIINAIKKYVAKEPPKILGRWNIDYCAKKINNKIDLSNEDHCGPCGEYSKMQDKKENAILIKKK